MGRGPEAAKAPAENNDGSAKSVSAPAVQPPSSVDTQRYEALNDRLARLRQIDLELLAKYRPENSLVLENQRQIESLDRQRRELEQRFPSLVATSPAKKTTAKGSQIDLVSERAKLSAVEAKAEKLTVQVAAAQEKVKQFSEIGTQIAELWAR